MSISWAQKKADMQQIIKTYYADSLRDAGFVNYKNDLFQWFKVKNGLLYSVRMPVFSPAMPIKLVWGFGIIPLFTWEKIYALPPYRDWPARLKMGNEHFCNMDKTYAPLIAEQTIGKLPHPQGYYLYPEAIYNLPDGLAVWNLHTERLDAPKLEELILPMIDKLDTLEKVYQWNKDARLIQRSCASEHELLKKVLDGDVSFYSNHGFLSHAFADMCLYLQDVEFYPAVLHVLKGEEQEWEEAIRTGRLPLEDKTATEERIRMREHARVMLHTLETGDRAPLLAEWERIEKEMTEQLKKKFPEFRDTI